MPLDAQMFTFERNSFAISMFYRALPGVASVCVSTESARFCWWKGFRSMHNTGNWKLCVGFTLCHTSLPLSPLLLCDDRHLNKSKFQIENSRWCACDLQFNVRLLLLSPPASLLHTNTTQVWSTVLLLTPVRPQHPFVPTLLPFKPTSFCLWHF